MTPTIKLVCAFACAKLNASNLILALSLGEQQHIAKSVGRLFTAFQTKCAQVCVSVHVLKIEIVFSEERAGCKQCICKEREREGERKRKRERKVSHSPLPLQDWLPISVLLALSWYPEGSLESQIHTHTRMQIV